MESKFDKLMKERLLEASSSPPKDLWNRIEGKLDAFEKPVEEYHNSSFSYVWKYAAAALVSGIAVALGFLFFNQNPSEKSSNSKLPTLKTNVEIGNEMTPKVEVVEVASIKQPQLNVRTFASTPTSASDKMVAEESPVQQGDVLADGNEDLTTIPVFSLKLNKQKTSSLNEKIKVISGEPVIVEVDEELNYKQIMIYQRLKIINNSRSKVSE